MRVCIIFYNDAKLLKQCLLSVKESGLKSIAIDGRFKEFGGGVLESTDGSIEIAKKYSDKYIKADESFLDSQMSKRNRYIQEIKDGEYFLVLDSDEKLIGIPDLKLLKENTYSIALEEMDRPISTTSIRVHKKRKGLKYALRHCYLFIESEMDLKAIEEYNKTKEPKEKLKKRVLTGCITRQYEPNYLYTIENIPMLIEHYQDKRHKDRQLKDVEYMNSRKEINVSDCILAPNKLDLHIDLDIELDATIEMIYFGKGFRDCINGQYVNGNKYKMTYRQLRALQVDFSPFNFRLVREL